MQMVSKISLKIEFCTFNFTNTATEQAAENFLLARLWLESKTIRIKIQGY
jgi:hypothetical protein